tara:strand:+ start:109 stop:1236 length:1128 start_codon:yes stop_codon:yes gene_type:complete
MDSITKYLNNIAYKFPKGYPDMDNPKEKKMLFEMVEKFLEENADDRVEDAQLSLFPDEELASLDREDIGVLLKDLEGDDEAITYLKKYIKNRPKQKFFTNIANDGEITTTTLAGVDAPQELFNILVNNNDVDAFEKYILKNHYSLSGLKSGGKSNLINDLSKSGISANSIRDLINFGGTEGGRGVGKAEIALALLLKDVKMMVGKKGDLNWNGNYLEVKGTSGRLGKRDQTISRNNELLKKVDEYEDIANKVRPDLFIPDLIERGEDRSEILRLAKDLAKEMYGAADNIDKILTDDVLENPLSLRKAFQKIYVNNYVEDEGVKDFIFVDTSNDFGNYLIKSSAEMEDYIDQNPLVFSGPISTKTVSPSTFVNGIK